MTDQPRPDLVVLSLGAGVQSTTLALLAADGTLPTPDVAVFADTGWEPAAVYEHLARLEQAVPFPVIRVQQGNLRDDILSDSRRFAALPFYLLAPPSQVPLTTVCPTCDGVCPDPADVEQLDEAAAAAISCHTCRNTGQVPTGQTRPATRTEREGMGRRQCTSEYKLTPITRKVRELLGAAAPDFRRVPRGRVAEQWIGFSTDEVGRANRQRDSQGVQYLTTRYPLLDLGMSRSDCERYLRVNGWGSTTKSACIGCPYHGNRAWRDLRDNRPDEWADAVAFDAELRSGGGRMSLLDGTPYLHRSRLPLDEAPIDRVTRREWSDAQLDVFDAVADVEAGIDEDGDPDGCSPYGCRSGDPVLLDDPVMPRAALRS